MKLKFAKFIAIAAGSSLTLLLLVGITGCDRQSNVKVKEVVGLDFDAPIHYLSHEVEAEYPTSKAIPKPGVITALEGGAVTIQAHADSKNAQLRVINLPKSIQSDQRAAEVLAESGAIQDCDILLSFRPEWADFNGYCNIQLGISHTALATIDSSEGTKIVQTVESPLSYSSRLDYDGHYEALDYFHIVRPNISSGQKKNVRAWALKILGSDHDRITFFTDYGTPYMDRDLGSRATGNLPVDLARTAMYPNGNMKVGVYCSELVWAILALRDIDPSAVKRQFPSDSGKELTDWLTSKINPLFDPLPGASDAPLSSPGLMQGPDVLMRSLYGSDNDGRRKYLLDEVLLTKITNPARTEGHLSPGHAAAANMFRVAKLPQLRDFYSEEDEAAAAIPSLNKGIRPNYSPTAFFLLGNLPKSTRKVTYVATVAFKPVPETVATAE